VLEKLQKGKVVKRIYPRFLIDMCFVDVWETRSPRKLSVLDFLLSYLLLRLINRIPPEKKALFFFAPELSPIKFYLNKPSIFTSRRQEFYPVNDKNVLALKIKSQDVDFSIL